MAPLLYGAAAVAGLGLWAFSGEADASVQADQTGSVGLVDDGSGGWSDDGSPLIDYQTGTPNDMNNAQANMAAFLAAVRQFESDGQYTALVGGGTFSDRSKFPTWAGYKNSHAAGAYQFQPATWAWVASNTGRSSMSNDDQDTNATWLANFYAADAIARGDMVTACAKLSSQWQSIQLKGEGAYAQAFSDAGGTFA